ncbi:MAG: DUF371 domain-containing protein [Candidatus Bathyarchaeia archaeon]
MSKQAKENIVAFGHENIQAIHPTTLMFTKEKSVSNTGDCIVAVAANKALADLAQIFKDTLRKTNAKLTIIVEAAGLSEQIKASGSPKLILTHPSDIVIRKSSYISDRTLAIDADKSSNDLSRELVAILKNPKQKINITLTVQS